LQKGAAEENLHYLTFSASLNSLLAVAAAAIVQRCCAQACGNNNQAVNMQVICIAVPTAFASSLTFAFFSKRMLGVRSKRQAGE
jgi:hypothetical protein